MRSDIKRKPVRTALFFILVGFLSILTVPPAHQAVSKRSGSSVRSHTLAPLVTINRSFASTTTATGVTLSPPSISFGYQLVGTTGNPMVETVTNSGAGPLVITDISVSGRDRGNFKTTSIFNLPVTVAPGNSITIGLSFTPSLPWRPGTRDARLEVSEKVGRTGENSQYVALTGIGANCGGPLPSSSSGCTDSDGDGLNDAWEIAGGIDLNNDGQIDATYDLLLQGADSNRLDIYVQYDYMGWATPGADCAQDSDCTSGGATPNYVCHEGRCNHNHKPDPEALQIVVDSFARHGVALHIDPNPHEVPHSDVITFAQAGDGTNGATATCAGADIQAGTLGGFAVSLQDIKAKYFDSRRQLAYHYVVFSHFATCLQDGDPNAPGYCGACANDRGAPPGRPTSGISGTSELPGNDFIVSLGARYFDANIRRTLLDEAGVFMHELGHNLGLHHDGDNANHELAPNYLSVMNNKYVFSGIQEAEAVGSTIAKTCNSSADCRLGNFCFINAGLPGTCRRVDYSTSKLNTIRENALDETLGLSPINSGLTDIVRFFTFNGGNGKGAAAGPIDWDGLPSVACDTDFDCAGGGSLTGRCTSNGICEVQVDLNKLGQITETFVGYNDWDHGGCNTSADCPVNGIRQFYHDNFDSLIDPHEPCVQNKCQTLWYAFQSTKWGKKD